MNTENTETRAFFHKYVDRMVRAARLDPRLYEEVEADKSSMGEALGVVVLSSFAAGVGTIGHFGGYQHVFSGMFWAVVAWFVWALLTFWIGTHLLPGPNTEADLGQLLRTTGFSAAPGMIRVVGILPGLMAVATIVSSVWMLVAMVIAVRQALDYDNTWRAVGVCLIGWLIQLLVVLIAVGVAT